MSSGHGHLARINAIDPSSAPKNPYKRFFEQYHIWGIFGLGGLLWAILRSLQGICIRVQVEESTRIFSV